MSKFEKYAAASYTNFSYLDVQELAFFIHLYGHNLVSLKLTAL